MLGVNLWGVIHGVQAFVPRMLAQPGEKHIVNTGSTAGLMPTPGVGVYATAKYAVVGLSEHLRLDLAAARDRRLGPVSRRRQTQILRSERNRPSEFGPSQSSPEDYRRMAGASRARPTRCRPRKRLPPS